MSSPSSNVSVFCLAMALGACDSPRSELEPQALDRAARNTASLSAEASLLTQQVAQGNVNKNFVWVHQRALRDECLKVWESLHKPVPEPLRTRQEHIVRIQDQLETLVDRIAAARADAAELEELRARFDELSRQARAMQEKP